MRLPARHPAWIAFAAAALFSAAVWTLASFAETGHLGVFLPGTQPADGQGDPAFPAFRNGTAPGTFSPPSLCASCHRNYRNEEAKIYEPFNSWSGSMMANSARDPLFWAALDVANQDDSRYLGGLGFGDFCIRCHVPQAWYEGRSHCNTPYGEQFDGACLTGTPTRRDSDFEGVQCHFCHRMYDASDAPLGQFADVNAPYDGNARVYLSTDAFNMRGPFGDAVPRNHGFAKSTLHSTSQFCGQCHDITNPARNMRDALTGADLGRGFPIERTFREWQQSAYGVEASRSFASCQSCHMPEPDLNSDGHPDPGFACSSPPGPRGEHTQLEGPMRSHFFRGGSVWMTGVLRDEYGAQMGRGPDYDAAIESATELLTLHTADVALRTRGAARPGSVLEATVRVVNKSGHKFPTGYSEGRRAWINLQGGIDLNGDGSLDTAEISFESGAYDSATGALTEDPALKLYEIQQGVFNWNGDGRCDITDAAAGRKMFHFALNDCIKLDNRIPPKGFVPNLETQPVGYVYPVNASLPGTLQHWDDTAYAVPLPAGATGTFLLRATLYYQSASVEYVEFLRDENRSTCDPRDAACNPTLPDARQNRGEKMYDLWQRYGRTPPVAIGVARASIRLAAAIVRPGEASPAQGASDQLRIDASAPVAHRLTFHYQPACAASDHSIYWGALDDVSRYAYAGVECGVGASGTAVLDAPEGSLFFVVVGNDGAAAGSAGLDSSGQQRPAAQAGGFCDLPLSTAEACDAGTP